MDEVELTQYITTSLAGVDVVEKDGDRYFFYDPGEQAPPDRRFPFATLVTGDRHDQFSQLDRTGIYRLNIGVSKETFRSLLGPEPFSPPAAGTVSSEYDFTAIDRWLPHPVYGSMYWVSVLNPGAATLEMMKSLLAEAYEMSSRRQGKTT
ncbi:hypothetical protein ETAA8_14750 [Anatilimnocola aggregata]|uniref:DUF6194 domain-containing protein n=1 Tax=Anatilimnocola aggregata TaxID=2528021 RepID=A0A517Y824_9BACT|nr:DUF6194 family protein [Anatilimnocola aggregata]QDU26397.1 hypothetical protein ETAA8_14750 [Anatilimnocola aggregata]